MGVSVDRQETNDRFRESLKLPYPLVGDPKGAILKAYTVRRPLLGLARRATYVVGAHLKIAMAFQREVDPKAHADRVVSFLAGGS